LKWLRKVAEPPVSHWLPPGVPPGVPPGLPPVVPPGVSPGVPPGVPPGIQGLPYQLWAPPPRLVVQTLTRRAWIWVVAATAVVAASIGAMVGIWVNVGSQQTVVEKFFPNQSVLVHPTDVQEVIAQVEPAVVSISTLSFPSGRGAGEVLEGAGTGMILTSSGEVLTNDHVIAGASTIFVTLFGQTSRLVAHVVGADPPEDVALIQIAGQHGLPTVTLGSSGALQVGDDVLAIGNALDLEGGPTVTEGIVSALDRTLTAESDITKRTETLRGLIQTDAPINSGNSGGPLLNAQAQVIGMNTAVAQSGAGNAPAQNIGFAIAIDTIKSLLPGLRSGSGGNQASAPSGNGSPVSGRQGSGSQGSGMTAAYLGVEVVDATPALAHTLHLTATAGAVVVAVTSTGPAERAGVKTGDVIVSMDGSAISSSDQLAADVSTRAAGDRVSIVLYRGSRKLTMDVTLGSEPG